MADYLLIDAGKPSRLLIREFIFTRQAVFGKNYSWTRLIKQNKTRKKTMPVSAQDVWRLTLLIRSVANAWKKWLRTRQTRCCLRRNNVLRTRLMKRVKVELAEGWKDARFESNCGGEWTRRRARLSRFESRRNKIRRQNRRSLQTYRPAFIQQKKTKRMCSWR